MTSTYCYLTDDASRCFWYSSLFILLISFQKSSKYYPNTSRALLARNQQRPDPPKKRNVPDIKRFSESRLDNDSEIEPRYSRENSYPISGGSGRPHPIYRDGGEYDCSRDSYDSRNERYGPTDGRYRGQNMYGIANFYKQRYSVTTNNSADVGRHNFSDKQTEYGRTWRRQPRRIGEYRPFQI